MSTPNRPPFKVSGVATIKHLNVRKEGPEDDKILAVDVKLEIKNVDRRLCGFFDEALEAFLWRGNTNALIMRNAFLTPVQYAVEVKATVIIGAHEYPGCEVKRFQLDPRDGGVMTLTCSVSVYPNSADVSDLAKLVQDETHVLIEGLPDLFDAPAAKESTEDVLKHAAKVFMEEGKKAGLTKVTFKTPKQKYSDVSIKYRGPNGETWTGRGLQPRWLTAYAAQAGCSKEDCLVKHEGTK